MKIIKRFVLGKLKNNCYLIEDNQKIILIDAPGKIDVVAEYLDENDIILDEIYLTHAHYDHIEGLNYLVEQNYINEWKIYCPKEEIPLLKDPSQTGNLSAKFLGREVIYKYNKVWCYKQNTHRYKKMP